MLIRGMLLFKYKCKICLLSHVDESRQNACERYVIVHFDALEWYLLLNVLVVMKFTAWLGLARTCS